jgi:hypothetical protein
VTYTGLLLRESLLDDAILATLHITKTEVWHAIPKRQPNCGESYP